MDELKEQLDSHRELRERFCEDLGARIEANYDLLAEDPEEVIELFFKFISTEAGAECMASLLGVKEIQEISDEFQHEIDAFLEEE